MNRKSITQLFLKILIFVATFLLVLEFALQIGSFVVWKKLTNARQHSKSVERTVLCVGDSFTYGFGSKSSEGAYPAQLQKLLGKDTKVINRGWPGQNSEDAARRMDLLLSEYKPSVVFIMIGMNDQWSRAGPYQGAMKKAEKFSKSFPWKWRTGRLVTLLRSARWFSKDFFSKNSGPVPVPRQNGSKEGGHQQKAASQTSPQTAAPMTQKIEPKQDPEEPAKMSEKEATELTMKAWKAFRSGELETAEQVFREVASENWSPARSGLVAVLVRKDRRDEAFREIDWLRTNYKEHPGEWAGINLAQALAVFGNRTEATQLLKEIITIYPASNWAWQEYGSNSYLQGDKDTGLKAIDQAIKLTPDSKVSAKAYFLYWKAMMLRENQRESMKLLIQSFLLDKNQTQFRHSVFMGKRQYKDVDLSKLMEELGLSESDRKVLEQIHKSALSSESNQPSKVLEANLRFMVSQCLAHGAEPILVSYPLDSYVNELMRRTATENEISYINIQERFDKELKKKKKEELFAPDGHCNDGGYSIIASSIATFIFQHSQ